MALLQISEPGMSPVPHQRKVAIGIDLGTTHSLVATVRSGMPQVLTDQEGRALLPSVVRYLANGCAQIGYDALPHAGQDPSNTFFSIKRWMGRGLKDISTNDAPYQFIDTPGMVQIETVAGAKTPVHISAAILSALRQRAEAVLGIDTLVGAVITVPAYFDEAQRQATKDAAQLAGINVLRLLNEPTAAAIAYGLDHGAKGIYAVYDLGGGTFDISILKLSKGTFEVVATGGDTALGGDDFDRCLYHWVLTQAQIERVSDRVMRQLILQCRRAKEDLSTQPHTSIHFSCDDGQTRTIDITQEQFFSLSQALVDKTLTSVQRALNDAGMTTAQIDGVVMVGGATRMPHVQKTLANYFSRPLLNNLDPDQIVALGAAMQANLLAGNQATGEDWLLLDVIPLSLGVETMGGLVEKIIPRNATIPLARAQEFTTFKDGQTAMSIHVLQGERELAADCRSLARFDLRGIPPMVAGAARIRVTYQVDADGLLAVTAREMSSGIEAAISVKPSYGLADDDIARMLQESNLLAEQDVHIRALREQQVDGQRIVEATVAALDSDAELLNADEQHLIREKINALRGCLAQYHEPATLSIPVGQTHAEENKPLDVQAMTLQSQKIKEAVDNLARVTEEFAARRMNKNIRQALTGKTLSQIENISGKA